MKIYLGTVGLEKNRWGSRMPSFCVSNYMYKAKAYGFDGIELWQEHLTKADSEEYKKICNSGIPIIFSTYCTFENGVTEEMKQIAKCITDCNAHAVKFNLGTESYDIENQIECLMSWVALLPTNVDMYCECHAGTYMSDIDNAKRILERLGSRYYAIVHTNLKETSFEHYQNTLGSKIVHVHSQTRNENNETVMLSYYNEQNKNRIEKIKSIENIRSITLEFTEESSNVEKSFEHMCNDYSFIIRI